MYLLVLFLDCLGAILIVALVRNFTELNLPLTLFLSLFPLAFALLSEYLKVEALVTGTADRYKNIIRIVGFILILGILVLGAYAPVREYWLENAFAWTRPVIGWLGFISLLLLVIPLVQEVRARKRIRYKKLMHGNLMP